MKPSSVTLEFSDMSLQAFINQDIGELERLEAIERQRQVKPVIDSILASNPEICPECMIEVLVRMLCMLTCDVDNHAQRCEQSRLVSALALQSINEIHQAGKCTRALMEQESEDKSRH